MVFCPSRFIGFFSGRRFGKTQGFIRRFKVKALSAINFRYGYLTPTAGQNEEIFDQLLSDNDLRPFIKRTKTRPARMWLTNGSFLGMYSFQRANNTKGKHFDEIFADESQDLDGAAFWRCVRPMLSDRSGTAIVAGQLPSKSHWLYKDFYLPGQAAPGSALNPLDNGVARYRSWAIPSWQGPVFWTPEGKLELQIARAQLPDWLFKSQYGCEPLGAENAVFPPDRLQAVTRGDVPAGPQHGEKYIFGHDIGRIVDPGATVGMRVSDGLVVHAARFPRGMKHEDQARQIEQLAKRWNDALVCLDVTGGGGGGKRPADTVAGIYRDVISNSRAVFLPWQVKQEIVSCLCVQIEQEKLSIPAVFKPLLEELGAYEATYSSGLWHFSAPKGLHDDLAIALALAVWGRSKGWVSTSNEKAVAAWY